eukprot:TRINITY_DN239_c2_g1_i1.p3 TRINITY_DN239_c2_g1~~TRINITY_DN239_c2_g1_i1.p3  ORF type:complete len:224 (+),score=10.10 TRINITY_DN239_c2_g1_i1:28-672(+)
MSGGRNRVGCCSSVGFAMQSDVICKMMYDLNEATRDGSDGPRWNFSRLFEGSQLEDVKMLLLHVYEPSKQIAKVPQAIKLAEFARKLDMSGLQTKVSQFLENYISKIEHSKSSNLSGNGNMPSNQEAWNLAQIINLAVDHQWHQTFIIRCESILFRCLGSDAIRSQVTNILNTDSRIRLEAGMERSSEWYLTYWQATSQTNTAASLSPNSIYPM